MTRRVTVVVFDPASTRVVSNQLRVPLLYLRGQSNRDHQLEEFVYYSASIRCFGNVC
jgi:hypothetical protein